MNLWEFLLIFLGSVFHLAWNVLAKDSKNKLTFLFGATFLCGTAGCLFFALSGQFSLISVDALTYLGLSALIHGVYFYTLGRSLQSTDLSLVYPYARGIGSLLATLGGLFWLHESPTPRAQLGIILTLTATFLEPLAKLGRQKQVGLKELSMTMATGLSIAAYFLVDKKGVQQMNAGPYLSLLLLASSLIFGVVLILLRPPSQKLFSFDRRQFLAGIFIFLSYGPILKAMESAPLTYVVATRAVGIVLSGMAGYFIFREKVGPVRWASIFFISIGIYLVGTA